MAPRLLAVNSEEMGFDGFCNSYLIRRGEGGGSYGRASPLGVFGRNLEESKPSETWRAPAFY